MYHFSFFQALLNQFRNLSKRLSYIMRVNLNVIVHIRTIYQEHKRILVNLIEKNLHYL